MRIDVLTKIYDDFVDITKKHKLEANEVIEFILSFILFNMREGIDEEDARVFCHSFYKSMLREIDLRKRIL